MTRARASRLASLEDLAAARRARGKDEAREYLRGLSNRELNEVHAALLLAGGHEDPEGEAARRRKEIQAMSSEDLRALIDRLEGGRA